MNREIESHLALLQEDFERHGIAPAEAALAARRAYGGVEQSRELHRDARSFLWIEELARDVRYGWQNLLRNPGFTLVAVVALALGIGVNAAIFGFFNAIAFKQLPLADSGRMVRLKRWYEKQRGGQFYFTEAEYRYLREHSTAFAALAASDIGDDGDGISALATAPARAVREQLPGGHAVSANYFAALEVRPRLGRTFLPDEDRAPGANAVVVLDYRLWQRSFHGDPRVIGQMLRLNGVAYTIIGVAPRNFSGTDMSIIQSDFWVPLSMAAQIDPIRSSRGANGQAAPPVVFLLGRLKNGVSRQHAQAEAALLIRRYAAAGREPIRTVGMTLQDVSYFNYDDLMGFRSIAAAVAALVALVLLVACANVANMLLARGAARQREIAVRLALGAGRGRVIRQLLTESVLLACLAGAAAIPLSAWAGKAIYMALIGVLRGFHFNFVEVDVGPDAHVFAYGLAVSLVAGVLFGLAPALRFTRLDLSAAMKDEGWLFGARLSHSRLRGLLLGSQVAVSVLLLMTSAVFMAEVRQAQVTDLGYDTRHTYMVMTTDTGRTPATIPRPWRPGRCAKSCAPCRRSPARLLATSRWPATRFPQSCPPVSGSRLRWPTTRPMATSKPWAYVCSAGAISLPRKRLAARRWRSSARPPQSSSGPARTRSASASRSRSRPIPLRTPPELEVIGVANDIRDGRIDETDSAHVHLPTDGSPGTYDGGLLFRIRGDREKALSAVQSAVEAVDRNLLPGLNLINIGEGPVAMYRNLFRVLAAFSVALTLLALTLAAVGIYGVMAFLVSQQTREIGLRMALGATSPALIRKISLQGLRPVLLGIAIGFPAASVLEMAIDSSAMRDSLFLDPTAYALLAAVPAIAAAASVIPARRAMRVEPAEALRHE